MFRFWSSDVRGSQKSVAVCESMKDYMKPQPQVLSVTPLAVPSPPPSAKRRRSSSSGTQDSSISSPIAKRLKLEQDEECVTQPLAPKPNPDVDIEEEHESTMTSSPAINRVREVVTNEMGHEILLKHNELRLIEQELAKCQIALEQLRRCHLIPYPVNCPTPEQVVNMMSGKGPALQTRPGAPVPQWAPPFGVVDGPYARHYAKWLIPDPSFDGIHIDFHVEARVRGAEGRTTRNSYSEGVSLPPKRPARNFSTQKLQALSSGYPVKSDKAGPCTLIRQLDGLRVKLVCLDCNRENFSSTQGFINHCRIAHKRDYKSHEEAARKCGQPIGAEPSAPNIPEEKPMVASTAAPPTATSGPVSTTGYVHPFARPNLSEQEAYVSLQKRVADCVKLFEEGRHPFVKTIPSASSPPASGFVPSSQTPYLSQLLSERHIPKNLEEAVQDARQKDDNDELMGDDSEDASDVATPIASRVPGVMRIPARASSPVSAFAAASRPASSKGHSHLPFGATHPLSSTSTPREAGDIRMVDTDELEGDLSPNTMSSNNAPSLVSDDGEYEDSDMPSDSEAGDSMAANSVSDVAEITLEEDNEGRPIRHRRASSGPGPETVRLGKEDHVKHVRVTFVSPIKGNSKPFKNTSHGRVGKT
ncbi:uncharacterized protein MKZ38_009683 [Zalerion maritima]|uniref:AHC1-like C2H2 zinc-finger domain-containing protein n=1 Tax=Zalerion maritima TaxID=339359 RepID=A0AAD5RT73_9PEZI|nr:uncharacterized protein MKZ38_009683 [Zalerion maritima]